MGLEDVRLEAVHDLRLDDLLRDVLPARDHVLDDDGAALHQVEVGVGEQVEEALVPLLGLEHLPAALLALRGEHREGAAGRAAHLDVLVVAAEQHQVLDLVVLPLAALHVQRRDAEVREALEVRTSFSKAQ